ncbi:MAG TPA: phage virion morphogenesis protein [Allosphingosinicella sp.]|uniref:phage virion morphogenesis protein n=1 Tax=Allosphingosinicella sp. TaxID=2823234 RepID=UPI002ED8D9D5
MADLEELERIAGAMLRKLEAGDRRQLLRKIARDLQRSQVGRVGRQEQPDGSRFPPRKEGQAPVPGGYAVKFLYPKGAAEPRLVFMKSWVREGPLLTGYDIEAGGIRSFFWDKVDKWLPVERDDQNKGAGKFRRKGKIRRQAMFRKLGRNRFLRAGATDREAWIGFSGAAARVARIHQEGRRDRPSLRSREIRYPKRELLGITSAERAFVLDSLLDHIA